MVAPPSTSAFPSPLNVCPGCGVIAPVQRTSCILCNASFGPAPLVAPGAVGNAVFARIHESDFECRGCGLRTPVALGFDAEVECQRCGLRQAFTPGQWEQALDTAHAIADLCGPNPEGRFLGLGPSIAAKNPSKSLGVEHTRTESKQSTTTIDGNGTRSRTLRILVSPGHPLCHACHLPLHVKLDAAGKSETECARCGDRATYALPTGATAKAPALRAVIGEEHRTDRPRAKIDAKVDAAGVAALTCPSCGAGLPVEPGADLATCSFCHTTSRVARKGWAQASGAAPAFDPFWVLLEGPSKRRRVLQGELASDDEDEDDGDDDDAESVVPSLMVVPKAPLDGMTIRMIVGGVIFAVAMLILGGSKLYEYLNAHYDLGGSKAPAKPRTAPRQHR
jgi:hypothetical protein